MCIMLTVLDTIHCESVCNEIMNVLINVMQSRNIYNGNDMICTRNTLHITFLPLNGIQTLQLIACNAGSFERYDQISDIGDQRVLTEQWVHINICFLFTIKIVAPAVLFSSKIYVISRSYIKDSTACMRKEVEIALFIVYGCWRESNPKENVSTWW